LSQLTGSVVFSSSVILDCQIKFKVAFRNMFHYKATVVVITGVGADLNPAPSAPLLKRFLTGKTF
jgi:hypothetical protein